MDQQEFDQAYGELVRHVREVTVKKMEESAMVMSLVPDDGFDVKFAVELGAAIMLNKPLMVIQLPGRSIPDKLRTIADVVLEADIDTEEGLDRLGGAMEKMTKLIEKEASE